MIVRYIKMHQFNELILSYLDSSRICAIENLTNTRILIDMDYIQIIGEASNSRQARLLIQHSILLTLLNANPEPLIQMPSKVASPSWQQVGYNTIKKVLFTWNSTLNLFT
jgi:hypothetical protein